MKTILSRKVNKKAWLRIVEAFFAIILILGTLLILLSRQDSSSQLENEIAVLQTNILSSISKDAAFREDIIQTTPPAPDLTEIKSYIEGLVPAWMNFSIQVCEPADVCPLQGVPLEILANREIYSQNILIFATSDINNPKQLKLFMWRK